MNRIRQLRQQKHIGQMEFAKLMGVSQPTVSDWENGRKHPSSGKLVRLSEVLGASISYILGSDLYDEGVAEPIPAAEPDAVAPVPAPVASTPAADPRAYEKIVYEKDDINPDIVPIGEKFMMRVFDNSMKPRIQENDYIVVLRQDEAENGALMLLQVGGNMLSLKRVETERGGLLLASNSPFFRPVFYSKEDIQRIPVRIIGKVVELRALF